MIQLHKQALNVRGTYRLVFYSSKVKRAISVATCSSLMGNVRISHFIIRIDIYMGAYVH